MVDLVAPGTLANFLLVSCRECGEVLTSLKLQKLMYYSQSWYLALNDVPLFAEDFQAWVHGPVVPSQWHRFRDYQWRPIDADLELPLIQVRGVSEFISEIIDVFGAETAVALELMTHREQPWIDARGNLPIDAHSSNIIPKAAMRDYYRALGEDKAE